MADFLPAFERMIVNEGGYVLHTIPGDKGWQTYAGIARSRWPHWSGWSIIDTGGMPQADLVRGFYRANFWDSMNLNQVKDLRIAQTLFDFGVNAGTSTAAKLAQMTVGTTPDGQIGAKTIAALNAIDPDLFMAQFALAKLARYAQIANKDKTQRQFMLGWVNRTLKEAAL